MMQISLHPQNLLKVAAVEGVRTPDSGDNETREIPRQQLEWHDDGEGNEGRGEGDLVSHVYSLRVK